MGYHGSFEKLSQKYKGTEEKNEMKIKTTTTERLKMVFTLHKNKLNNGGELVKIHLQVCLCCHL